MSRGWSRAFRVLYWLLGALDPLMREFWETFGLGNVVEFRVRGHRSGLQRSILLGLLRAGNGLYLGHPNGATAWTRNVEAGGDGEVVLRHSPPVPVRMVRLEPGAEREAVIQSTGQHPFPGNLIYRLARGHIRAVGVYYRLEPLSDPDTGRP